MNTPNEDPNAPMGDRTHPDRSVSGNETDARTGTTTESEQELARLREERDHLDEQLKRTLADTANMRRRQHKEMEDARRRVLEGIAQELLPVLDNFGAALQACDDPSSKADPAALLEGVRLVRTLLSSVLERHGLQEIQALHQPFDPSRHEAVAVEPRADLPTGHVARVLQAGYLLGEHVIRHAKVIVTAAAPAPGSSPGGSGAS